VPAEPIAVEPIHAESVDPVLVGSFALERVQTVAVRAASSGELTDRKARLLALLHSIRSLDRVAALAVGVVGTFVLAALFIVPRLGTEEAFADSTIAGPVRSVLEYGAGPVAVSEFPGRLASLPLPLVRWAQDRYETVHAPAVAAVAPDPVPEEEPAPALPTPPPTVELAVELPTAGEIVMVPIVGEELAGEDLPFTPTPTVVREPVVMRETVVPVNRPTPTDFDLAPAANAAVARTALQREYPSELLRAGIGGRAELWFYVSAEGRVERVQLHEGTGRPELDNAALRAGSAFAFTPGQIGGAPAPGWVLVGVTFESR
jgi:TonB family protein